MRKTRIVFLSVGAGVLAVAFLALLVYLLLGGGKNQKIDYSPFVARAEQRSERIASFVLLEPHGVFNIGDPVTLYFGVVYDPRVWEVPDEELRRALPFPDEFEVRAREFHVEKLHDFVVLTAALRAQCFACRDKTYLLRLSTLRIKNKETGDVTSIRFDDVPLPKLRFAALTAKDYAPDEKDLAVLSVTDATARKMGLLVLAGTAFSVSVVLFLWVFLSRYGILKNRQKGGKTSPYILRVKELAQELESSDACSIAHSLYALVLVCEEQYEDEVGVLKGFLSELSAVYTKEGIGKEQVTKIIEQLEVFLKGEV